MSGDAMDTLGGTPPEDAGRDAIHVAVVSAVAERVLLPGQHVGIENGKASSWPKPIGVVDPYLTEAVPAGGRFWLFIYPRQITGLRHVWSHPAFPDDEPVSIAAPVPINRSASEEWMRSWAMAHMGQDYYGNRAFLSVEESYAMAVRAGFDHNVGPYEDARDHINDEWWQHWEVITGEKGERKTYFSCAC